MACRLANSRLTVENRVWAKIMRCAKHVGENGVEKPWCIRANGESTTAGASGCSDRFNRQLNQDEKKAIRDKANGDKNEEQRLTRAACYAVKCWAEYAAGSDERNKNFVSEVEAASLAKELDWVNQQKGSGLFEYTALQKGGDAIMSDPVGVAKNGVKVAVGGATTATGMGLCTTGLGCTAGTLMIAFGVSDIAEGADGLYNRYNGTNTPGVNGLRYGFNLLNPTWGDAMYDALNLGASLIALRAQVPLKMGVADGLGRKGTMFGVTVPKMNDNTLIPLINTAAPYGTTQAISLFGVASKGATVVEDVKQVSGGGKR